MEFDLDIYSPSVLYKEALVCVLSDCIINLLNEKKPSSSNIYRGQIGIVDFRLAETSQENEKELSLLMSKQNINVLEEKLVKTGEQFYSVTFMDWSQEDCFDDDFSFQTLLVQRKDLLLLRTDFLPTNDNFSQKTDSFKKNKIYQVKTELQIKSESDPTFKEFLEIYSYSSIFHTETKSQYNLGHAVTVQEILYNVDNGIVKEPLIYPGQIGIILKNQKNNKVEVVFLIAKLSQFLAYDETDVYELEEELENIYANPLALEIHTEIRIVIEPKYLIPLYGKELRLTDEGKEMIDFMEETRMLNEPIKTTIYEIES